MEKLREFARKRWHNLPVGIIAIAIVLSLAVSGTAYAAYSILNGHADVTVSESITYAESGDGDGTWLSNEWTVELYPAETKSMILKVNNAGTVGLTVSGTIGTATGLATTIEPLTGYTWLVPADGSTYIKLSVTASADITPSVVVLPISISR